MRFSKTTLMRVLLLIVNLAIVVYLVRQIWIAKKAEKAAHTARIGFPVSPG